MRAMADQGSSQAVRKFGVRVRAASITTPRDWSVNGDLHAHVIEESARVCARASNCLCSIRCFVRRRAVRSAQRVCRRADDQRHATRQCDSGLVLQLPARGFRSRRRPAHVLDPEQAELAGVLSRHRQAREDGDRRERRDLFEHRHQGERRRVDRLAARILDHRDAPRAGTTQPAADDQPHATRQRDSGLVLQLPARGFRSRRRPAHVLDPEQAELAGVLSRHRQAREDGDRRERRDLFEHHHQRERRQWRPPRCPHSRSP